MQDPMSDMPSRLVSGTPAFRRLNLALFAAGFSTFAILYCVQPLLPEFSREFHVSAAVSSLSLSLSTGLLAVAMLVAGSLSEVWGRKPVMVASLFASALLTILSATAPNWTSLLLTRMLIGITLSGLPAVAMAYVSEEVDSKSIGLAMGLFIGGNAIGGMAGRIIGGVLTDLGSWRLAVGLIGTIGLVSAIAAWRSLPASVHFHPRRADPQDLLRSFGVHLRDPGLRALFAEAFLLMGAFVTLYNYLGYRLTEPPYSLSQTAIGAIFAAYLIGTLSSAWIGELAGRLGRRRVLWAMIAIMLAGVALTLSQHLAADPRRHRRRHVRLLRRAFHRQQLGRKQGRRCEGAGLGPLPVLLLSRLQRRRHPRRRVLDPLGMERRRRPCDDSPAGGSGSGPLADGSPAASGRANSLAL